MISTRRKPFPIGQSRGVTLPASMEISEEVSMAANDKLVLIDTTGKTSKDKLLQFFIEYVEPSFHQWQEKQKLQIVKPQKRGFITQQVAESAKTEPGIVTIPPGFLPGPLIYEVVCPRCHGKFGWDVAAGGNHLYCLYCGLPIELTI